MERFPVVKADDVVSAQPLAVEGTIPFERRDPTPEEEEQFNQSMKAWELCKKHWDDNGKPSGLQVAGACPRCGGQLKYAVSAYNGHFAVWCDATGCLSMRE